MNILCLHGSQWWFMALWNSDSDLFGNNWALPAGQAVQSNFTRFHLTQMDPFSADLWTGELTRMHYEGSHLLFNTGPGFSHISIRFLPPMCHTIVNLSLLCNCGNGRHMLWSKQCHSSFYWLSFILTKLWVVVDQTSSPRLSHFPRLHLRVWIEGPVQVLLVASHDLPLCWVPTPQVTVHSVHSDHGDQPSSLSIAGRIKSPNEFIVSH